MSIFVTPWSTGRNVLQGHRPHPGLRVDGGRDPVHRHAQVFSVSEVHAVFSEHVAATHNDTGLRGRPPRPALILKIPASRRVRASSARVVLFATW